MFIGRVSVKHILLVLGSGIAVIGILIIMAVTIFHYQGRIYTWKARMVNFVSGKAEDNFQVEQSKIASCYWRNYWEGTWQQCSAQFFTPSVNRDFIYSVIIEEYGMAGGVAILFFYLWLLFRAGMMVRKLDRTFPAFLAIGLTLDFGISGHG